MENKENENNDIENKQNESKRVELYTEFLCFQWDKIYDSFNVNNDAKAYKKAIECYYKLFYIIENRSIGIFDEVHELIRWINENNNGKLPDNLQILFNEWILEQKL